MNKQKIYNINPSEALGSESMGSLLKLTREHKLTTKELEEERVKTQREENKAKCEEVLSEVFQ